MDTPTIITRERKGRGYYFAGSLLAALALNLLLLFSTLEIFYGQNRRLYTTVFGAIALCIFAGFLVLTRRQLKNDRVARLEDINLSVLRYVTGAVMLGYSFTKLFNGHMYASYAALDSRLNDLSDFDTVWSFYGRYSSMQLLLGFMELIPAVMLFFRRTTFLGALLMIPVTGNVVLLNAYYHIGGLTLQVSLLVLLFCLYILYSYKTQILRFMSVVNEERVEAAAGRSRTHKLFGKLKFLPLILFLLVFSLRVIRPAKAAPITGAYQLSNVESGDLNANTDNLPHLYRKIYFEKRRLQSGVVTATGFTRAFIVFRDSDSVKIAYRHGPIDSYSEPDPHGRFTGKYRLLPDGELVLEGLQESKKIRATYRKIPLREFDYWWQ